MFVSSLHLPRMVADTQDSEWEMANDQKRVTMCLNELKGESRVPFFPTRPYLTFKYFLHSNV